jgi:hypothetical protein
MSEEKKLKNEINSDDSLEWLDTALQLCSDLKVFTEGGREIEEVSAAFEQRCNEAGDVALSLAKLRQERRRVGFVPLSFSDYVQGLVRVANVRFESVLQWLQVDDLAKPSPKVAKAFAKLAMELDFSLRETLIHIRIGYASLVDSAPVPILLARHRAQAQRAGQLEECEVVLGQLEAKYDVDSLRDLRRTEFEIRGAFRQNERYR